MVKIFTSIFAIILTLSAFSQSVITGEVRDSITNDPIPYVHISILGDDNVITSNLEGKFEIEAVANDDLVFSYVGYEKRIIGAGEIQKTGSSKIYLARKNIGLDELEVFAGENPAHRIIRKASKKRKTNNPETLNTFEYVAYNKFVVSAFRKKDSTTVIQDTIARDQFSSLEDSLTSTSPIDTLEPDTTAEKEVAVSDTFGLPLVDDWSDTIDVFDSTNIFMMETVTQRYYAGPQKDKSKIIASRVSGFKQMDMLVMATQIQPMGLYEDYIYLFGRNFLNPISKGATDQYFFHIRDTLYQEQDSIFVISFHPFKGKQFIGLRGVVYINSDGYGVQNIVAEPDKNLDNVIRWQQQYMKVGEKWFPTALSLDIIMTDIILNDSRGWISSRTNISNIQASAEIDKAKLKGYEIEVLPKAYYQSDSVWSKYRPTELSRKEQNTYLIIDSVGKRENLDQKLRWVKALATGKLRTNWFDWELKHLLDYNLYEGIRVGVGGETNENLLKPLRIGGYAAYGFGDNRFKYGGHTSLILDKVEDYKFHVRYQKDVFNAAGRPMMFDHNWLSFFDGDLYKYYVEDMYWSEKVEGAFEFRALKYLTGEVNLGKRGYWQPDNNYRLLVASEDQVLVGSDDFYSSYVGTQLRFAYGEKQIRLLNQIMTLGSDYPVFYLNFRKSFDGILGSNLSFTQLEMLIDYDVLIRNFGRTTFKLSGGAVWGDLPYYLQSFIPGGQTKGNYTAFNNAFNTMPFQQLLARQYVMGYADHNFGLLVGKSNWSAPFLHVELAGAYGWNSDSEVHQNLDFEAFNGGYYEAGISIRDLLLINSTGQFGTGLGVGGYYRFGPYNEGNFMDDFAVRVTFNFNRPDF